MKKRLLSLFFLSSILLVTLPTNSMLSSAKPLYMFSSKHHADLSTLAATDSSSYLITWTGTATGFSDYTHYYSNSKKRVVVRHSIKMEGYGIVRPNTESGGGRYKTSPLYLRVTDELEETQYNTNSSCSSVTNTKDTITNPNKWMNSIPFFLFPSTIRRSDGSYTMRFPLQWSATGPGGSNYLAYPYLREYEYDSCNDYEFSKGTEESNFYTNILFDYRLYPNELTGDASGSTFILNKQFQIPALSPDKPEMTVRWNITARRLGNCAGHPTPIDASDPVVNNIDMALTADDNAILPDEQTNLNLRVTCDGVPVRGAQIEVGVEVQANSGGHIHNDRANPRPRGSLNGTRLTEEQTSIIVQTNDRGTARVSFQPGKDTLENRRGIAGIYVVTARAVRFPDRQAQQVIVAERTDFVELQDGDNYDIVRGGAGRHPEGTWGLQTTIDVIANLADDFQRAQEQHNQELIRRGRQPWRIAPLSVNDISLQHGGLFDVTGFDVIRQRVVGRDWQPPHRSHREGTGIDLNSFRGNPHRDWLVATLRQLGENYGRWERREPSLHLEVNRPRVQAVDIASSNPDPAVSIFFNDLTDTTGVAAGQTISYTIGLNNMNGVLDADNTVLSTILPDGLTFVSANPSPTSMVDNHPVWSIGTVTAGALPETFSVVAQVDSNIVSSSILTVTAEVNSSSSDANQANNHDAFELIIQPLGPDLVIQSDLGEATMTVDRPVTITLGVANLGNASALNTVLSLTLPHSVTLRNANPLPTSINTHSVYWSLGDLPVDAEQSVIVTLDLDPRLSAALSVASNQNSEGVLTYTLSVSSIVADIDPDNNHKEFITPITFVGSDVVVLLASPNINDINVLPQDVNYTLVWGNFGNEIAYTTGITLSLPSGISLVSAEPALDRLITTSTFPGGVATWNLNDLPSGASGVIQIRLRINSIPAEGGLMLATTQTISRELNFDNNVAQYLLTSKQPFSTITYLPLIRR